VKKATKPLGVPARGVYANITRPGLGWNTIIENSHVNYPISFKLASIQTSLIFYIEYLYNFLYNNVLFSLFVGQNQHQPNLSNYNSQCPTIRTIIALPIVWVWPHFLPRTKAYPFYRKNNHVDTFQMI